MSRKSRIEGVDADEVTRMPVKEFRRLGFLQEVNRKLLHPCGLAIEVLLDPDTGEEILGGIWDYRGDREGLTYADGALSAEKAGKVAKAFSKHKKTRKTRFGWVTQPVPRSKK